MSYSDAVSRISQIQGALSTLPTAFTPPPPKSATGTTPTTPTPGASFASQLAQAQSASASGAPSAPGTLAMSGAPAGLAAPQAADLPATPGASLSPTATQMLTSGQQQFATRLAADTGLDCNVIAAWLLAEESGGAAASRQSANNNDWLNIGYTDGGTYGSGDSIWRDPLGAADATAGWLRGQNTIPGYGTAAPGVQAILRTAGESPTVQIAALQQSGWASSGYPDVPALYQQIVA